MRIDQLGEFGLIERIRQALPQTPGGDVLVGIGDDVAVLRTGGERVWLATCDVQVEGAHFLRDGITPQDLGHKALAINLSDIASAGGTPRFALISLGLPKDLEVEFVDGLYQGLRAEAEPFGVDIVGGNISSSRLGVFIDITLLGDAPPEAVLLRSGAKAGDAILVTGTLGDAAAGVALLLDSRLTSTAEYAAFARLRRDTPTPRVKEGQIIGAAHTASAMIDISDGLAGDLGHICEKSAVGVRLFSQKLPVSQANRDLSKAAHGDEWYFALHGGEDYELLFTAPPAQAEALAGQITSETGTPLSIVGEILPPEQGQQLVLPDGSIILLQPRGWDHFKENK
ncbi:MAG: thiamine-phosphate kinase [Anaerolineaceae bacterium]|nr:thiamine-phosphate kinase [Anaerolineaceae bacterium]